MLVWCLLKNVWVRQVANSFIQFISQAPCITLVQFHINCYLKKKNFHHSGLQPDLITWPHSPGLMDGLEWMTWSLYKIKRNVFHLLYTSFCFLLGPYLKRINTFNNVLKVLFSLLLKCIFHHDMPASFVWLLKHFNKETFGF